MSIPRKPPTWLTAVPVVLYFVLSILYLLAIPLGESPDEPGHMQCIAQVAQTGRLPKVDPLYIGDDWWARPYILSNQMCYHMPLYYLTAGTIHRLMATAAQEPLAFDYPPSNPDFESSSAMFLHETNTSFWQLPGPVSIVGLRLFSVVLGLTLVWASYVIARRVFPEQHFIAVLAATLTAGWPQFLFLSRAINNDALATALAVLILVVLLNVGRPYRFIGAAVLSSLAVLTKLSVAFVVVAVLAVWGMEFFWLGREKRPYLFALFGGVIVWLGTFLLITWHPVINANLQQSLTQFSDVVPAATTLAYWQQIYVWTLSSGWAWFGWLSLRPSSNHALIWWLLIQMTIILGIYWALKGQKSKKQRLILMSLAIWTVGVTLSYVRININRWQPQFRFALSLLPVLTVFSAGGWLVRLKRQPSWQMGLRPFICPLSSSLQYLVNRGFDWTGLQLGEIEKADTHPLIKGWIPALNISTNGVRFRLDSTQ